MSRTGWNALATVFFVIGFVLGVMPLVQWFAFGHRNGLVERLTGAHDDWWVWGAPGLILVSAIAGVLFFGTRGDKAG